MSYQKADTGMSILHFQTIQFYHHSPIGSFALHPVTAILLDDIWSQIGGEEVNVGCLCVRRPRQLRLIYMSAWNIEQFLPADAKTPQNTTTAITYKENIILLNTY